MKKARFGEPLFVGIQTSSYSGATLTSFLLNAHPQIATTGEMNGLILKNPEDYVCSCGKKIRACEFWQAVTREMADRGYKFDVGDFDMEFRLRGPAWMHRVRAGSFGNRMIDSMRDLVLKTMPGERRQFEQRVARNLAFVDSVLKLTGKSVFVDTSKDHLRVLALRLFSDKDVRAIHLVRDPRGVTASKMKRNTNVTVRQAANQWVRLHTRLQSLLSARPPHKYKRVRYEDLCQDPRAVLRELYTFCGVDPDFEIADYRAAPHHIVGNPMRLEKLSVIKLDERWREVLTREQQNEIWQIAGGLGMRYGYSA